MIFILINMDGLKINDDFCKNIFSMRFKRKGW